MQRVTPRSSSWDKRKADVAALTFLSVCTIVNGTKRILKTPRRLIGILIFLAYFYYIFRQSSTAHGILARNGDIPFALSPELDYGIVFLVLAFLCGIYYISVTRFSRSVQTADADVLFPTPVSVRLVLLRRLVRDSITSVLPLFFFIVFLPSRSAAIFAPFLGLSERDAEGLRAGAMLGFVAMGVVLVFLGYAQSLWMERGDDESERVKGAYKLAAYIAWVALPVYLATVGYITRDWEAVLRSSSSLALHILYLPATFSTWIAIGYTGDFRLLLGGILGDLALLAIGLVLSMRQADWLYDQAAVAASQTGDRTRLARSGDWSAIAAQQARQKKKKRVRSSFLSTVTVRGPLALIWRDLILQFRVLPTLTIFFFAIGFFYMELPLALGPHLHAQEQRVTYLSFQAIGLAMLILSQANTAFFESVKRGDLVRSLPFTGWVLTLGEVIGKSAWLLLVVLSIDVVQLVCYPSMATVILAAMMLGATLIPASLGVGLVSFLGFPDITDPSQKLVRGLISIFGLGTLFLANGLLLALGNMLGLNFFVSAIAPALLNGIVLALLTVLGGGLFRQFSPAE